MYNLKVHQRNKHGNQLNKAPTTLSVGPDGGRAPTTYHAPGPEVGRAPTTVSVPPLRMGVPYAPHTSHYGYGVQAPTTQYGHHGSTSHQHVSNPHPYAHPYINNQVGPGAQSIPPTRLMAQHPHKYEYGEEVRAPTKVSVGPKGPKAPNTTIKLNHNKIAPAVRGGNTAYNHCAATSPTSNIQSTHQMTHQMHPATQYHNRMCPVTQDQNMMDADFTHFLALEFSHDTMLNRFENNFKKLQESMSQIEGMGKAARLSSLHLIIATLNAQNSEEAEEIHEKSRQVLMRFMDLINAPSGIMVTFDGVSFGEHQVDMNLVLLDNELDRFITDYSFNPHLGIYRKCKLEKQAKTELKASVVGVKLGSLVAKYLTLRENQKGPVARSPLAELEFISS